MARRPESTGGTPVEESDLLLVARRWDRRSAHTSVERFLAYFPGAATLTTEDLWQRPDRLLHLAAAAARQDGYTIWGVEFEARAVLRSLSPRRRPRVVHFLYGDHDYHFSGRPLGRLGVKTVATFFFSVEELERRMPHKRHLRHLDLVLASGRDQLEYLSLFVDRRRLALLPLGVDTGWFTPGTAAERVTGRLLQVGANRRDLVTLREAYQSLAATIDGLTIQFVGCDEAATVFAGLDGVTVSDHLSDEALRAAYRQAEVVVLPLLEGGSSNALNEALACGVPVVATDRPNVADYAPASCVTLVAPGDPVAFAEACRRWLVDPQQRTAAADAARRQAVSLDWSVVRDQLLGYYAALLER